MSARRRRLVLKPRARQDLRNALHYTRMRWGAEQHTEYKTLLYGAMRELVEHPGIGAARGELCAGCRSRVAGQHIVYYRFGDEEVEVVRVLHARQDAAAELSER